MKRMSLLAAPLLVVGLLAGCGDDGGGTTADAPTNASVEEFCQPFVDMLPRSRPRARTSPTRTP